MTDQGGAPTEADLQSNFDAWAAVSVRLVKRTEAEATAILAQLGLSRCWPEADQIWQKALCNDIESGRQQRLSRYAELCAAELAARRQGSGESEGWSIEHYARLCAELQQYPDQVQAVYDRYGIGQAEVSRRIMDSYNERLAADRQLYDRWQALVSEYRRQLSRGS